MLTKLYYIPVILLFFLCSENLYSAKEVSVIVKNPIMDSLANTHIEYSMINLFALGNEALFKELGSENYIGVRIVEFLIFNYAAAFSSAFSHEWAHYRLAKQYGFDADIKLYAYGGFVTYYGNADIYQQMLVTAAGVNQQEMNAGFIYEKMVMQKKITYYQGTNFMMNHFGTFAYTLFTWIADYNKGDINNYEAETSSIGMKVSSERMFLFSALSVFSSVAIWQNFILFYNWIANNKREAPLLLLFDKTIAPPLMQYYLTDHGDFLDFTLPILKPLPIFFSMGFGLKKSLFRVGARFYVFNNELIDLIPYGYFSRLSNTMNGGLLGIEMNLHVIPKTLSFLFLLKYSKHDVLERLKMESGLYATLGVSFVF